MSTVRLVCDEPACQAMRQGKPGVGVAKLREQLAAVGWWSSPALNRDICSLHNTLGARRAPK